MHPIFEITRKDLTQNLRDFKTYLFLIIMPVAFTLLFGMAFGGFDRGPRDSRLPVGFLDEDRSDLSRRIMTMLEASEVIRLERGLFTTPASLEAQVAEEDLAAALVIPAGYGQALLHGRQARLVFIGNDSTSAGQTTQSEAVTAAIRLENAVRTALILEQATAGSVNPIAFNYILEQSLEAWQTPPITIVQRLSSAISLEKSRLGVINSSIGTMLQFAIAGLLVSAQVLVNERKTRALQRMLTTAARRTHILLGHYLSLLLQILLQFTFLILFAQLLIGINYLHAPVATALISFSYACCIAALGLLIGVFARNEEQAIVFSLVPMFILSGIGGAWVPLEVTGPTFQAIGHLSPLAWAMDGLKNIALRGYGLEAAWMPAIALAGYTILFFFLAAWRFSRLQEA